MDFSEVMLRHSCKSVTPLTGLSRKDFMSTNTKYLNVIIIRFQSRTETCVLDSDNNTLVDGAYMEQALATTEGVFGFIKNVIYFLYFDIINLCLE